MGGNSSLVVLLQTLSIDGGDGGEQALEDLRLWLEQDDELKVTKTPVVLPGSNDRQMSLTAVLLLVLGTKAAVAGVEKLGDAIIAWINARRPRIVITLREGTHEVRIDATSPPSGKTLADQIHAMLPSK